MEKAHDEQDHSGAGGDHHQHHDDELIDPRERGVEKDKDGLADYITRGQQRHRNSLQIHLNQPNAGSSEQLFTSESSSFKDPDSCAGYAGLKEVEQLPQSAEVGSDPENPSTSMSGPQWTVPRTSSPDSPCSLPSPSECPGEQDSSSSALDGASSFECCDTPSGSSDMLCQSETPNVRRKPYPPINFKLGTLSIPPAFQYSSEHRRSATSPLSSSSSSSVVDATLYREGAVTVASNDRSESVLESTNSFRGCFTSVVRTDHLDGVAASSSSGDDGKALGTTAEDCYENLLLDLLPKTVAENPLPDLGEKSFELERVLEPEAVVAGDSRERAVVVYATGIPDPESSVKDTCPEKMDVMPSGSFPWGSRIERLASDSPDSTFWTGDEYENVSSCNSDILMDDGLDRGGKYQDVLQTSRESESPNAAGCGTLYSRPDIADVKALEYDESTVSPATNPWAELRSETQPEIPSTFDAGASSAFGSTFGDSDSSSSKTISWPVIFTKQTVTEDDRVAATAGSSAEGAFLFGVPYKDISRSFEYSMRICCPSVPSVGESSEVGGIRGVDQEEEGDSGIELTQNVEEDMEPAHGCEEQTPSDELFDTGLPQVIEEGPLADSRPRDILQSESPEPTRAGFNSLPDPFDENVGNSAVGATDLKSLDVHNTLTHLTPPPPEGVDTLDPSVQSSLMMSDDDMEATRRENIGAPELLQTVSEGLAAQEDQDDGVEPLSSGRSSLDISEEPILGFAAAAAATTVNESVEVLNDSDVLYIAEVPPSEKVGKCTTSSIKEEVTEVEESEMTEVTTRRVHTRSYSVRIEEENKRVLRSSSSSSCSSLKATQSAGGGPDAAPSGRKFRTGSPIVAALKSGCPPSVSLLSPEEKEPPKKGKKRQNPVPEGRVTRSQARKMAEQKQQPAVKKLKTG